eukprot:3134270-Amphidinium_carterae.1
MWSAETANDEMKASPACTSGHDDEDDADVEDVGLRGWASFVSLSCQVTVKSIYPLQNATGLLTVPIDEFEDEMQRLLDVAADREMNQLDQDGACELCKDLQPGPHEIRFECFHDVLEVAPV